MKTLLKFLVWTGAMIAVSVGIVYAFWLVLLFMLFQETVHMWLAVAAELVLFGTYFWLVRQAEC